MPGILVPGHDFSPVLPHVPHAGTQIPNRAVLLDVHSDPSTP